MSRNEFMKRTKVKKGVAMLLSICILSLTVSTSFAKDEEFDGWDEEAKDDAWTVFAVTDWNSVKDDLVFAELKNGTEVLNISKKVEKLRNTVERVLIDCPEEWGSNKNSSYTNLMLAMIQVLSDGNPDENDPCNITKYLNANLNKEDMTPERSIRLLFSKFNLCERAHGTQVSVYENNEQLQSVVQGVILGESYTEQNSKYSVKSAQQYIDANQGEVNKNAYADFAQKVSSHYSARLIDKEYQYEGTGDKNVGQQIAQEGLKYIGKPYVYGGNSLTNGIDCSGFTKKVHEKFGIVVPRSSAAQRKSGKAINGLANALPGDIICYDGHVALYTGNGNIVHASNPKPYPEGGVKTGRADYRSILAIRRYW